MNNLQYLLGKLAEEAVEIAQMALKTQQFGLYEQDPTKVLNNKQRLHSEINDLIASIEQLNTECGFDYVIEREAVDAKIAKVKKYREYSVQLGMVKL